MSDSLRAVLSEYADRGVFRSFSGPTPLPRGGQRYVFLWLTDRPTALEYRPRPSRLTLVDFLPGIPARSAMDRDLRAFLRGRTSPDLPPHRRIDPSRLAVRAVGRGGNASIEAGFAPGDLEYAARTTLRLANEIHFGFLSGPYEDYMAEHFGAPRE